MASKRKSGSIGVSISSMREALEYVEACGLVTTAEEAAKVWKRIQGFPPAMVLFSTQTISNYYFSDEPTEETEETISKNLDLFHQISEHRQFKCCRGPAVAKHMHSSEIVSVVKPLMTQKRKKQRGKKKLSHYSELIDVLMKFTHVDVDQGGLDEWEPVEEWINATVMEHPLLAHIVDPAFMYIRGNGGGAPPPWIQAQLDAMPVGQFHGGLSQAGTAANVAVRRPGGPPIPNLYQFASLPDAQSARAHLQAHANALATAAGTPVANAQLDILRLNVTAAGMVWI